MKRLLLTMCAFCTLGVAHSLTLEECLQLARQNYPVIKQFNLTQAASCYDLSNASKAWLPKISLQGSAYGFTNILNEESRLSQMGLQIKNYVASANLTVQQTVYDGGQIAATKNLAEAKAQVEAGQTEVTLYNSVRERVLQIYFGLLLIDEQLKQNDILQQDLGVSLKNVDDLMRSGLANQSDHDALQVELLKARQQRDAFSASRSAYLKMLATFVGKSLGEATALEKPTMPTPSADDATSRPELTLFSSQDKLLEAKHKQLNSALRPTIGFLGQSMFHTKVTDMVNKGLLLGALTLKWNLSAFYTRKNDLRKLNLQQQQTDVQRQTFLFQNQLQREETDGTIAALRKQLESDDEIVKLHESIRRLAERKVLAGTESVNELVRHIQALNSSQQQKALHEMQLLKAAYQLKNLKGK